MIKKSFIPLLWNLILILVTTSCGNQTATPTPTTGPTSIIPSQSPTKQISSTPSPTNQPIPELINELEGSQLEPGFSLIKYAEAYRPTAFAFDKQGHLWVTSVDSKVRVFIDQDHDNRAETVHIFAEGLYLPLGIAIHPTNGNIYVSHQGAITILQDTNQDYIADINTPLVTKLPFGLHQNDNLTFGPDGMLYLGLGSTCDACSEADLRSASILQIDPDTGTTNIYAKGLRNPYGLTFSPTGELFATDNGRDDLGKTAPFEELNLINQGYHYGWPYCWNENEGTNCENTQPAIGFFEARSSANSLDFYTSTQFPQEYQSNLFVAIFGSFVFPDLQTGIKRIVLTPDGDNYKTEITWFARLPQGVRPLPLVQGPDGALYFGDYMNDTIYRISYGTP